jgi:hypothetical protein
MGTNPRVLPDRFLKRMAEEDRKELGKAGMTQEEAEAAYAAKAEKEMHEVFSSWLRSRGIEFIHSRMDKRPTIEEGWPDYTILHPVRRAFFGDFKVPGTGPNPEQKEVWARLCDRGFEVHVWSSVAEAIATVINRHGLEGLGMARHD